MRSLLFVPGDSPGKLAKGFASGADALILDLEDSVADDNKQQARQTIAAFLSDHANADNRPRLIVRVNPLDGPHHAADIDAIIAAKPDAVMLPKSRNGNDVTLLSSRLSVAEARAGHADGAIAIIAIATETAGALFGMGTYQDASPRLDGLTWGAEDLSADLGAETARDKNGHFTDPYRLARALTLFAANAASVQAIDTVFTSFRDLEGLRHEAEAARRDGFTGKMAIHPAQVPVINAVFTPTPQAIARAQAVVAALAGGQGVAGIDGEMIDRPHLLRAGRLLARARAAGIALD